MLGCADWVIVCSSALRVFRAETRLTVYRSFAILEQFQLVAQIGGSATIDDILKKMKENVIRGHWMSHFILIIYLSWYVIKVLYRELTHGKLMNEDSYSCEVPLNRARNKKNNKENIMERYTSTTSSGTSTTHSGTVTTHPDTVMIYLDSYNLTLADRNGVWEEMRKERC